jgi:crotonobetainyl-CoA:carnitine CoA-transferase CaiB-like acyl-CoA transferase
MSAVTEGPLAGVRVLDLSRMVPGAVLARGLLDLGAEVIKVEDPRGGDPLRWSPPLVGGVGIGFAVFYRGAAAVTVDLRTPAGSDALRELARTADVVIESFRPGTLDRWGVGPGALQALKPELIVISLPGFPPRVGAAAAELPEVAHDLNLVGLAGLLDRLPGVDVPQVLLADVTTGLLATTATLAALLERGRTGRARHVVQPLAAAPLPYLLWPWADATRGGPSMTSTVLAGRVPCYGVYRCSDGLRLAVGCLEPKFWAGLCAALERPDLANAGLELDGPALAQTRALFAAAPRETWLDRLAGHELPVTPVHTLAEAREAGDVERAGLLEACPLPDGSVTSVPGPSLPSLGVTPRTAAPALGADNERLLRRAHDAP